MSSSPRASRDAGAISPTFNTVYARYAPNRGTTMELHDLTHDEQLALVALVELAMSANVQVSENDDAQIQNIAAALGEDAYRALVDEVNERFQDEDALKGYLATIRRQEAREVIYAAVLEAALPDVIDRHGASLLTWLATTWSVTVQFDEEEPRD
jgi:hypothetical protein